jgi:hypothetical protein
MCPGPFQNDPRSQGRFCLLSYRPNTPPTEWSRDEPVVLLAIQDPGGRLSFLAHPRFAELIKPEDAGYFRALIPDLVLRAEFESDLLLKQLSELNLGPLATFATGEAIAKHPELVDLTSGFIAL